MASGKPEEDGDDFMLFGPPNDDGSRPFVRHEADHSISVGTAVGVDESHPAPENCEVIHVEPREGTPFHNVVSSKGPAKINSDKYRDGWGRIFGKKPTVGQA